MVKLLLIQLVYPLSILPSPPPTPFKEREQLICMCVCRMINLTNHTHVIMAENSNGILREEPSQINVIVEQKLPAAKLSALYTVYKQ